MNKLVTSVLLLLFINACALPKLGIMKEPLIGEPFKLQGFYYRKTDYNSFVFYKNGVVTGGLISSPKRRNIDSLTEEWANKELYKYNYNFVSAWGLFKVKNDSIKIRKWGHIYYDEYSVNKISGTIINDSTIYLKYKGENIDTFYFHYLAIKPDSTNQFIK
jgi:hypothetical protein